jgi:hypothetical protein
MGNWLKSLFAGLLVGKLGSAPVTSGEIVKILIAAGVLLYLPASAVADGNDLLKRCGAVIAFLDGVTIEPAKNVDISFCLGFMQGISQTNLLYQQILKGDAQFCLPAGGITNGQAARIVVKSLRDHPEDLHKGEFVLAVWALKDAFPCKNE